MKTAGAVKHKLKQVQYRHRAKAIERALARKPCNCVFNGQVPLPDGTEVSVCLFGAANPTEWSGSLCDEEHGGLDRARGCEFFIPRKSREEIKREFDDFVRTENRAEIALHWPDMAALLWVLEGEDLPSDSTDDESESGADPSEPSGAAEVGAKDSVSELTVSPEDVERIFGALTANGVKVEVAGSVTSTLDEGEKNLPVEVPSLVVLHKPDPWWKVIWRMVTG